MIFFVTGKFARVVPGIWRPAAEDGGCWLLMATSGSWAMKDLGQLDGLET